MSRNNDADGYWAFGFLLGHALASGEKTFSIDFVSGQASTVFELRPLRALPLRYQEMFWNQVQRQRIPLERIRSAVIEVSFDLALQRGRPRNSAVAEYRVSCRLRIVDDRDKLYEETLGCWCFPHDPHVSNQRKRRKTLDILGRWLGFS